MAKRIYCASNAKLYQYREGGNYYFRHAGSEFCLDTPEVKRAETNMALQEALLTRFGTTAFQFKLGQLFPKFLEAKKAEVRPGTYKLYEGIWTRYFEKRLSKISIANMNQRAWSKFCDDTPSVSDFQNLRNLMHQFLVWCEMKEFILAVSTLKNPKHKRRRRKIIPPEHLRLIFQYADGSLLLFLSMALFMGMRRSEIMKLSWARVDLVNRKLALRDEDVKTDEGREIPLNAIVVGLLIKRLKLHQDESLKTPWVFPNAADKRRHAHVEGLMNPWRVCLLKCGLAEKVVTRGVEFKIVVQYTWHDLRATFEKYSHISKDYTDTQKEKMVGADIDVQKRIYVSMGAEDLRGLEEVVSLQMPELTAVITNKTTELARTLGKDVGKTILDNSESDVSHD